MFAKLTNIKNPQKLVTLCFTLVFLGASLLVWREGVMLEQAYISDQRNTLDNIASSLDKQLQHSVDILFFYQQAMEFSLDTPFITNSTHPSLKAFNRERHKPWWSISYDQRRTIPVFGVSEEFVEQHSDLMRNNRALDRELSAALELSYLLPLSRYASTLQFRTWYISRAGMFVTSNGHKLDKSVQTTFRRMLSRPFFAQQSPANNPDRAVCWSYYQDKTNPEYQVVTASVPLDYEGYWYGVIGMDFTLDVLHGYLKGIAEQHSTDNGSVYLLDSKLTALTSSQGRHGEHLVMSPVDQARLAQDMSSNTVGALRMQNRFITWAKLDSFDGVLIREHNLYQGLRGDFGHIILLLVFVWVMFTVLLIGTWYFIRRLVTSMSVMQSTLSWRANYDTMTRLFNRGAFIDQAQQLSARCRPNSQPFSVIQLDLDHFKSINDTWGHQAGDKVLKHAAAIISNTVRGQDIAGRVGGEEFCIVMPGASITDAAQVAERIREKLASKPVVYSAEVVIAISASFGVSSSTEKGDYDFEHLQSVADNRLYAAKEGGRNRVCAED
ncbi:diguanylate cyclase [Mangrovibacter sp. MFB070]|uniref:cellulose biosynthesis regulator diguanylate cyclase DgcQ n=1 Tax=Mangrovibacter sp. MFB070 TaxID=1224318 RepID=UPI0004D4313D|nr:cellulose biosynthesis regulator diguanylate cyclase DgcQ [Mangrovibacter sp. MFB070]KEA54613.1 diguanylate cyclase [Mangrovibacter sp. MFB070]